MPLSASNLSKPKNIFIFSITYISELQNSERVLVSLEVIKSKILLTTTKTLVLNCAFRPSLEVPRLFLPSECSYLEVGGVHTQGEGVQLAQVEETRFQIVDFGHSVSNGVHDGDSVLLGGGRVGALVLPVGEVGLGLRVHGEQPGLQKERKTRVRSE